MGAKPRPGFASKSAATLYGKRHQSLSWVSGMLFPLTSTCRFTVFSSSCRQGGGTSGRRVPNCDVKPLPSIELRMLNVEDGTFNLVMHTGLVCSFEINLAKSKHESTRFCNKDFFYLH